MNLRELTPRSARWFLSSKYSLQCWETVFSGLLWFLSHEEAIMSLLFWTPFNASRGTLPLQKCYLFKAKYRFAYYPVCLSKQRTITHRQIEKNSFPFMGNTLCRYQCWSISATPVGAGMRGRESTVELRLLAVSCRHVESCDSDPGGFLLPGSKPLMNCVRVTC